jgi:hypothetical protein
VIYYTIASGLCQSSYSWVEVPQNSRPYFTVSSETPPTWRARFPCLYPPGTGWTSYTPGHWVFQIRPISVPEIWPPHGLNREHRFQQFLCFCLCICCRGSMFIKPFSSSPEIPAFSTLIAISTLGIGLNINTRLSS